MSVSAETTPRNANRLLAALPPRKYRWLLSSLQPVHLSVGRVLHEAGQHVRYVYFPNDSMISLIAARADESRSVEVGVIGRDGMTGVLAVLGYPEALYRLLVQLPGTAMRAGVEEVREAARLDGPFRGLVSDYTRALLVQLTCSCVCNCFHTLEQRLARWILITGDYAESDEFAMKQEFMAQMLGARRTAVTQTACKLQRDGLINYQRGVVRIADRDKLGSLSCHCYRIIRNSLDSILEE
jgi:CRP-like cAMP-binding protein